jgi:hypothetical protein
MTLVTLMRVFLIHHFVVCVRFKVYVAVTLKNTVLWDVLP